MIDNITNNYDSVENLTYEDDGNYHIHVPTFYEFGSFNNDRMDFIFDTGAYITVIAKKEAALFGFDDSFTIKSNVPLAGFTGSCLADIKVIPGIIIGGRWLEGLKVAVPHVDTATSILGLNVLEYFKFFIDTENDDIYFKQNPKPEIPMQLHCGKIHLISDSMGI